jgi:hypothetical protein
MAIRAVVFDIGGVLEITPDLGVTGLWENRLGLRAGELSNRMHDVWAGGGIGTITEDDVHQAITDRLGSICQPGSSPPPAGSGCAPHPARIRQI